MIKKTHAEFMEQIEDRNITALTKYTTTLSPIQLQCKVDGHKWAAPPCRILRGAGCPVCGRRRSDAARMRVNLVRADHGGWLLIDISTDRFPDATMAVDAEVWSAHKGGVYADKTKSYLCAKTEQGYFHHFVLPKRKGRQVDHRMHGTGNFIDNRRSNLRYATPAQNSQNRSLRRDNSSGTAGVAQRKESGRWRATITIVRKRITLGTFTTQDEAIKARQQAEREYFGEFAYRGEE